VTSLQAHQVARRGLARTFQATTLFKDATALDNVLVGYRQRMSAGLLDELERRLLQATSDADKLALSTGVREMILPGGMGSSFQVLVQKRGV